MGGRLLGQERAEPQKIAALIDRAAEALRTRKADPSAVLADAGFMEAHGWPRFRGLIREFAAGSRVTIVTPTEPGKRLRVRMRLVEAGGAAITGALVYFYHTDAGGTYGPNDAGVPLAGSDNEYSRLFGYARTDSEGAIQVRTIRPGGYPESDSPAHIHVRIWREGRRSRGAEIWFEDDPRITRQLREEEAGKGVVICPVTKDGEEHAIEAVITLE
jgi:protocatechuate 3,4-dioxygenase beta subunit